MDAKHVVFDVTGHADIINKKNPEVLVKQDRD